MSRVKYYLDENVAHEIAAGLRTRGIDVVTTAECGNKGAKDRPQVAFALSQQRVIITHDRDFLRLDSEGEPHPGIAYCAKQTRTVKQMLHRLLAISKNITAEEMMNHVEYL